ncbi:unnamed protein product, partial [Polarella glacialis]
GVRAMTGAIVDGSVELTQAAPELRAQGSRLPRGSPGPQETPGHRTGLEAGARERRCDPERITFLDTPGHEAFELLRGRTMAAADVAVVVVSVEFGAEVQTEEVLIHASRWKVPVIFALNKIDLPEC